MAGASEKDEEMPQHMVVPHLLADIEKNAAGVKQTACQYPPEKAARDHREHRFHCNYA